MRLQTKNSEKPIKYGPLYVWCIYLDSPCPPTDGANQISSGEAALDQGQLGVDTLALQAASSEGGV